MLKTWPALRIDFSSKGFPEKIVAHLKEAITCHAEECYTAAAMMVRRTLEELCDERGDKADNLKRRISDLKSKVVLPGILFDALDHIRLLGNDAAHINAETYEKVGAQEVAVAIDVTKEILRACYQMEDIVNRMTALQKNPTNSQPEST